MDQPVTIEELRKIIALKDLPDEHLEWILSHSEYNEHEDGEEIVKTGEPIDVMWILIEGKVYFYMNINGKLVYYFSFENNETTGGIGGLLPYSRMKTAPGTSYAVGKVRVLKLHKKYFHELEQLNPDFNQKLIGYMTERARIFATTQLQQEKVSALGKLAAGIAHELNNPASAIDRISEELNRRLKLNIELTEGLLNHNISPTLMKSIRDVVANKGKNLRKKITPLQRIQKEEELLDWLTEKEFKGHAETAETFVEAGITKEDLENINGDLTNEVFGNILEWLENLLSSNLLIKDLEDASSHITNLVGAIKSHVHMDRSGALHSTNIHEDIENSLTLLGYKIRDKNINVIKNFDENIPEIEAYIGELNQVWTNIIDNAIFALPNNGELRIETTSDKNNVCIRIIDNGCGIPKEIQSRIFDPFFTTKKVGEGTGIGLDLVQNVVKRHHGDVKVFSEPGKTEFSISLPISQQSFNLDLKDETPVHYNN